jgi:TRAP-type C4-dicarboxylate transport system substrate-binding protein
MTLTRHLLDPTVVAFSLSEWNALDAQEQATVMEASKLATDIARALSPIRDAESLAALQAHGMVINEIDMSEARAQAADVQRELAAALEAEDLLQQILAE